jgi:hypothetical protein
VDVKACAERGWGEGDAKTVFDHESTKARKKDAEGNQQKGAKVTEETEIYKDGWQEDQGHKNDGTGRI